MMDINSPVSSDISYDTLFISPSFFGYAREIENELASRGRSVLRVEDRPGLDTVTKTLARIDPKLVSYTMERYFSWVVEKVGTSPIRDVLVIKGEALSISMIKRLRSMFPAARFTLYFWDSYRNLPRGSKRKVDLFDRAFSFDMGDVETDSRLTYRPLFFLPHFAKLPEVKQDIDLFFVGSVHTDRYRVLKRLKESVPHDYETRFYMYYQSRSLLRILRQVDPRLRGSSEDEFAFTPLGRDGVSQLMARSKIAVDIERPVQRGLTIRTFEMMAARKKIITTNPRAAGADFFHPNNIAVIDRRNPTVSRDFLDSPFEPLPAAQLQKYSLTGWVDDVLPNQ